MEEHTLKLTNVHTQLLLQVQNEMNIQMMNERLFISQNEFQITKAALDETEKELQSTKVSLNAVKRELQATKIKLKQSQEQVTAYKKDTEKKENQIAFLQEDIRKQMANIQEYIKSQNQIVDKLHENSVLELDERLTELFLNITSKATNDDISSIKIVFKTLETKNQIQNRFQPMEPFFLNGINLKFPKLNQIVKEFDGTFYMSFEKQIEILLKKMVNGEMYHVDDRQFIFKLYIPKNRRNFFITHHPDIAWLANTYPQYMTMQSDQLVVLDNLKYKNDHRNYLQTQNYNKTNSKAYMYPKNEKGKEYLLKYENPSDIDIDGYRNANNEVLFHITKNI